MFLRLGGRDSGLMMNHGFSGNERRAWRAVVFALAVVAQLLVPAITMRAQALAAELCAVQTGDDSSGTHTHQQQCAHCRVHDCSALPPPAVSHVAVQRVSAAEPAASRPLVLLPRRLAQPPPTGPPAL